MIHKDNILKTLTTEEVATMAHGIIEDLKRRLALAEARHDGLEGRFDQLMDCGVVAEKQCIRAHPGSSEGMCVKHLQYHLNLADDANDAQIARANGLESQLNKARLEREQLRVWKSFMMQAVATFVKSESDHHAWWRDQVHLADKEAAKASLEDCVTIQLNRGGDDE